MQAKYWCPFRYILVVTLGVIISPCCGFSIGHRANVATYKIRSSALCCNHVQIRGPRLPSSRLVVLRTPLMMMADMRVGGGGDAISSAVSQVVDAIEKVVPGLGRQVEPSVISIAKQVVKQSQGRGGEADEIVNSIVQELEYKLVDEDNLMTMTQFQAFEKAAMQSPGGRGQEQDLGEELKRFSTKLDRYIKQNALGGDDVAELKAIVMMTGRSMDRRFKAGVMDTTKIRDDLEDALYAQIVEREGLISVEDWGDMMAADSGEAQAQPVSPAQIMFELKQMFPQIPSGILLATAQQCSSLDEAIAKLTAPLPSSGLTQRRGGLANEDIERPDVDLVGGRRLRTRNVNAGCSAYGLFFDVTAKQKDIVVTGIRTGASAGLGLDGPRDIALQFFWRPSGSGLGYESSQTTWEMLGEEAQVKMPLITWMETDPKYRLMPQKDLLRIKKGQTVGFCVRTNNVFGVAIRMQPGKAADSDMLDEDFGGKDSDDDVAGVPRKSYKPGFVTCEDDYIQVRCGYTCVSPKFECQPSSAPVPAAFVGDIEYQVD